MSKSNGRLHDAPPAETAQAPPVSFLESFDRDPSPPGQQPAVGPPPIPATTFVTEDSVANFNRLALGSNAEHFGATGLMAVVQWQSPYYGTVEPGTVFLFPGTSDQLSPPYSGPPPTVNGGDHVPLVNIPGNPMHKQLCALLGAPTTCFIGFATHYPLSGGTTGYNSGTCNKYWFDGDRALPVDWQILVWDALARQLTEPQEPAAPSPSPAEATVPAGLSARTTSTEGNTPMSTLQITTRDNAPLPSENDVKLALSASNATATEISAAADGLTVRYAGDVNREEFRKQLAGIVRGSGSSLEFTWKGSAAESAGAGYNINIAMSDETVIQLIEEGFQLYAFKTIQTSITTGQPVVWFKTDVFSANTVVSWQEQYQAYTSRSAIIPGGGIVATAAYDIQRGQTLVVGVGGTGTVVGEPDGDAPIFIENSVSQPYTTGISELVGDSYGPLCALPLHGNNTVDITPVEKVLLMFATMAVNTGTVIQQSFGPGALIDLTSDISRSVTYDIDGGWGPTSAGWLNVYPSRTSLNQLLIEQPSDDLSALRMRRGQVNAVEAKGAKAEPSRKGAKADAAPQLVNR